MPPRKRPDTKLDSLRKSGTVNPHPEHVRDPVFVEHEFFDGRDLVQVKYEMLRRVRAENRSVVDTVAQFGVSRPTFYKAQSDFDRNGLSGLLPNKRGPHGPHKVTTDVFEFILRERAEDEQLDAAELAARVKRRFGRTVHPRTIERALATHQKKLR